MLNLVCTHALCRLPIPPLQKAGRPKVRVPPAVEAAYDERLNNLVGNTRSDLYPSNTAKFWFRLCCGLHVKLCGVQHMCRQCKDQPASFRLTCRLCTLSRNGQQAASDLELHARKATLEVLDGLGGSDVQHPGIAVEVRLLREQRQRRYAAADVMVYCWKGARLVLLLLQADGEQHNFKPFNGSSVELQQLKDERYNQAVLAQGCHCVRLHHADTPQCSSLMKVGGQVPFWRTPGGHSTPWVSAGDCAQHE